MRIIIKSTAVTILFFSSFMVFASPADDAKSHFKAIAQGDVDGSMSSYINSSVFQWVGGPLDGAYVGRDAIRGVWSKFAKANAPMELSVDNLQTNVNPKGATVTANVAFKGKKAVKVRYVLTYRDGKLVNEVWQIDPKLMAGHMDY